MKIYVLMFLILFIICFFGSEYTSKYKVFPKIINGIKRMIWIRKYGGYFFYALLVSGMFLITIILYKSSRLILDNTSVESVYSFVWAVIMVFSMDIAISQLLYNDDGFVENNTYLGANSLSVLDKVYVDIHHFIRSISFDIVLIYFLIMPFLIFGHKRILSYPLWRYLWQTDYVIILIVLIVILISDFSLPHYVSKIVNNKDSDEIKFYVIHIGCIKLQHDIKKMRKHPGCIKSKFIKFIKGLINNSYSSKRSNYVPTLETFKLLYYMSIVLFNNKRYLRCKYINTNSYLHNLVRSFMGIVLKYFKHLEEYPINYRHKYTIKQIRAYKIQIIKNYVLFIDKLLCHHLIINDSDDIYLLPYKLINKNFIHCNKTWIKFNKLFSRELFIKLNGIDLKNFSYKQSGYNDKNHEIVYNNVKKFVSRELSYLSHKRCHKGDYKRSYKKISENVYNSLKDVFPEFLKEYKSIINS